MAEYIEREAAYAELTGYYHHRTEVQHKALREALERIPAADVKPVVRGEWIYGKEIAREYLAGECIAIDYEDIFCSVCKMRYRPYVGNFNYCPNCGADMRGKTDEERDKGN